MAEPEFIVPPPGLLPDPERPDDRADERTVDGTSGPTTRLDALNHTVTRSAIVLPVEGPATSTAVPVRSAPPAAPAPPAPPAAPAAPAPAVTDAPPVVMPMVPAPSAPPAPPAHLEPVRIEPSAPAATPAPAPERPQPARAGGAVPAPADAASVPTGPSRAVAAWRLRTSVGAEILVQGRVVLGRAPSPADAGPDGVAVPLHDPERTVSKVHAVVVVDGDALSVTDANSTNGVAVRLPGGASLEVPTGGTARVPAGAVLELGRFELAVEGPAGDVTR